MNELSLYNFGPHEVRELEKDGEPWFVAKDVCQALGFTNPRKALADHVAEEDKGVTKCDTPGGIQELNFVNESGLYALIFGSRLPQAKAFKRWVTHEVLPSIRKQGVYALQQELGELKDEALELHRDLRKADERYRKSHTPLSEGERDAIIKGLSNNLSTGEIARLVERSPRTVRRVKQELEVSA